MSRVLKPALCFILICISGIASASSWQHQLQALIDESAYRGLEVQPVAIFGDGILSNGIEDDRRSTDENRVTDPVGVVICDGKVSGSATLLNVSEIAQAAGLPAIVATASHVFYEEESGRPFKSCLFRLGTNERRIVHIDMDTRISGDTGGNKQFRNSIGEDWAFARLKSRIRGSEGVAPIVSDFNDTAASSFFLSAYDRWSDEVLVSKDCQVFAPDSENLARGSTRELLHDCDAIGGASGGAILTTASDKSPRLAGIHLGNIWSKEQYPPSEFPHGPRDWGNKPDPRVHANYFRVFDDELMAKLIRFVNEKPTHQAMP